MNVNIDNANGVVHQYEGCRSVVRHIKDSLDAARRRGARKEERDELKSELNHARENKEKLREMFIKGDRWMIEFETNKWQQYYGDEAWQVVKEEHMRSSGRED